MLTAFFSIERVVVEGAEKLYPAGLTWSLHAGINVVAGGTGLGKTSLIHATLFGLFGAVASTIPNVETIDARYFKGRLTDSDETSPNVTIHATFGGSAVRLSRDLHTGRLLEAYIDDDKVSASEYEQQIAELLGVQNFNEEVRRLVDCLIYLPETPTYFIAWDSRSQNEILTILFGHKDDFQKIHELWDDVSSADSQFRNLRHQATRLQNELEALSTPALPSKSAEAVASQRVLLEEARKREEALLANTMANFANAQGEAEQAQQLVAKLQAEYVTLSSQIASAPHIEQDELLFELIFDHPQSSSVIDSLSRLLANPRVATCPCCAQVPGRETARLAEVRQALTSRSCPVCATSLKGRRHSARPDGSPDIDAKLHTIAPRLREALKVHEQSLSRLRTLSSERDRHEEAVRSAREAEWAFKVEHPLAATGLDQRHIMLEGLRADQKKAEEQRDRLQVKFENERNAHNRKWRNLKRDIATAFKEYCSLFLDESVEIELDETGERAARRGAQIDPLHSAFYPVVDGEPRYRPQALSTAQRVFVDLAFRMALLSVWSHRQKSSVTVIVETPEGSVDTAYMIRVAEMLRRFGASPNQLLVTTNINNVSFLPKLLEKTKKKEREKRILNMLDVGKPRKVQRDHRTDFDEVIRRAIEGA